VCREQRSLDARRAGGDVFQGGRCVPRYGAVRIPDIIQAVKPP
jgi:hypothetical protein